VKTPPVYTASLAAGALKGARIGILQRPMQGDVAMAMQAALDVMRRAGATIVDVQMPNFGKWDQQEVLLYEFKTSINKYLASSSSAQKSLADLIAWNRANADRVMPLFGQEMFELAQAKGPLTDAAYVTARETATRLAGSDGLLSILARHNLSAIVAPSGSGAYSAAAIAGTPSITIPIGESRGVPLGLTVMGRAFSEPKLIGLAYALEQLTNARRTPRFLATFAP
jgi:amidase